MLGLNYGPDGRSAGGARAPGRGGHFRLCAPSRLSRCASRASSRTSPRFLVAAARPQEADVKVFVDTAPLMEKPLAAARRARLAGQAHQSGVARFRLLAVPGRDPHDLELAARRAGSRTIADNAAPASTPARPTPFRRPTSSTRGAASPISRSSTRARFRGSFDPRSATASTAATTASPSAPGTSSRAKGGKRSSPRATTSTLRLWPNSPASTMRRSGPGSPAARSSGSAGALRAQCDDRNWQRERSALANAAVDLIADDNPLVRGAAVWALARLTPGRNFYPARRNACEGRRDRSGYRGVARRSRRAALTIIVLSKPALSARRFVSAWCLSLSISSLRCSFLRLSS